MPAKLPASFIRQPDPKVGDLAPNAETFVSVHQLRVHPDGTVFVLRAATVEPPNSRDKLVRIRRDRQGGYHLDFRGIVPEPIKPDNLGGLLGPKDLITFESIEGLPGEK